ncbi:MAG: hypothetical protein IV094_09265 [Vitreoscilla sp.]|nr:hypothetical protein [Vitreoscilla sp.]
MNPTPTKTRTLAATLAALAASIGVAPGALQAAETAPADKAGASQAASPDRVAQKGSVDKARIKEKTVIYDKVVPAKAASGAVSSPTKPAGPNAAKTEQSVLNTTQSNTKD